jgi:hypothetical protein
MASEEEKKFCEKIVKKAAKEAVKYGLIKAELPSYVASGIADQLAVAYDLVKASSDATQSSGSISPEKLTIALLQKGLGMAKIASGNRGWQCGVAVAVLSVGLYKAGGSLVADGVSEGVLTPLFLAEAGSALADAYAMDEKCGISDAVQSKVNEVVLPIYMWFENGVKEIYGVPF